MMRFSVFVILSLMPAMLPAAPTPIGDGVGLNIGVNCQWQERCMSKQRGAMRRALNYVARVRPPPWRIHLCNRNAGRGASRVDWIGFHHCIRNGLLRPPFLRGKHRAR
jgi:hypothetical protein